MNWNKIPKHLRPLPHWPEETKRRVSSLASEYDFYDDVPGLILLQQFGNADSDEQHYREIVATEGAVILDRFNQKKAHPLVSAIRDARSQKLMAMKALDFDRGEEPAQLGRPPGPGKKFSKMIRSL
jgi:catechol 2,3-dioxygenase-like lactoylglutathione lyase family enzyme